MRLRARLERQHSRTVPLPENLHDASRAVHADPLTRLDGLCRYAGSDDRRDPELARDHRWVRELPAGIRNQASDLGEGDHPGRVRHPADEDLATFQRIDVLERLGDERRPSITPAEAGMPSIRWLTARGLSESKKRCG